MRSSDLFADRACFAVSTVLKPSRWRQHSPRCKQRATKNPGVDHTGNGAHSKI
jgi:hypothetical protein